MKLLFLPITLLLFIVYTNAQTTAASTSDTAKASVNVPATYPGGKEAWNKFLASRLRPSTAAEHGAPPGLYTVTVSYLIDTAGNITELEIIQDPGYGTADDVLHAFKKARAWIPATMNGKKVIYRQKQNFYYEVSER